MKNLLKTTVVTLALVTVFASAAMATISDDEYEFTALDKDVVIDFPAPVSQDDCNKSAILQHRIDLVLNAFQYEVDINEEECIHTAHTQNLDGLNVESVLADLGFDG